MSNLWMYTLVFGEAIPLTEDKFTAVIEAANKLGYSVWSPKSEPAGEDGKRPTVSKIAGMSHDGLSELEFHDTASARATMCRQGGLITLWKNVGTECPQDIAVTFDPKARRVSISAPATLHEDRAEDVQQASDMEYIFVASCRRLEPLYGYSTNEAIAEILFGQNDFLENWAIFENAVQQMRRPPFLFWLNYFSSPYFRIIGEDSLDAVPHRTETLEHGVLIYLANDLWNANCGVLQQDGSYVRYL